MRETGFTHTSFWWEQDHPEWHAACHRMPAAIRDGGLHLDSIHVPYRRCGELWSSDTIQRHEAVRETIGWVEDAARHGVPLIVMHVVQGVARYPISQHGLDSFAAILDAAHRAGVAIAIENTRSEAHCSALLEAFDDPALGLCYDVSHAWLHGDRGFELLRRWGHRLLAVHLGDTDGVLDRHWLPGKGVIPFDAFMAAFPVDGYNGCLMLEVTPGREKPPLERFLAEAYAAGEWVKALA